MGAALAMPLWLQALGVGSIGLGSIGLASLGLGALGLGALGAMAAALWRRAHNQRARATLLVAALDGGSMASLIADAAGRLVEGGGGWKRLFALGPAANPLAALEAAVTEVSAEAGERFLRLKALAAQGLPGHELFALIGTDGQDIWCGLSAQPLALPGRRGEGLILWRAEDVTVRRELEIARAAEQDQMADFVDHLPVGFFAVDSRGRFLFVSETLAGALGYRTAELLGGERVLADLIARESADDRPPYDPFGRGASGNRGEVTFRRRDGTSLRSYVVQTLAWSEDGNLSHTRAAVLLEGRRGHEAQLELRQAERRFHWLFAEAPVGIALLDLAGNFTDCNRTFRSMAGIDEETALPGLPFTGFVAKEDRGDVAGQLSKVVMGTSKATHLDVRLLGGRGAIASMFVSRLEDEEGEVNGLVLHFIDTTEQKNLEIQFAQSQKMQAMGQLAGGVAHDFNNLLTAMIGFCDLLLLRHRPGDSSFGDIMQIKQNANRAANLVRQLLAFSRRQTLQPRIISPTDQLAELSNLLRRLIGENIELKMVHGREVGLVRVDPGQLDQVIINLAVNARDAMPGGGTLTIRTGNIAVPAPIQRDHEVMPAGDYVLIEVADTGTGIARENLSRIFEPFFSTKEVGQGTGLGLSTVYGILRQTDGFVFVDSAPGEGTTFSIYLPRFEASAETLISRPDTGREALSANLSGAGTILLVEDEDAVRAFGARALRNKGYEVLEASSGERALELIAQAPKPIDVLISDVVMPGMNGPTLVRLVREEVPDIRVILISGYAEDAFRNEIGPDLDIHFLPKPFSLKQLAAKVKDVMEAREPAASGAAEAE